MLVVICFLLFCLLCGALWDYLSCNKFDIFATVLIILIAFCLFGTLYDILSPVEIKETIIITNDYEKYDLEIESGEPGRVKKIVTDSTNFGAMWKDKEEYVFLGWNE